MVKLPDRESLGALPSARTPLTIARAREAVPDTSASIAQGARDLASGISSISTAANALQKIEDEKQAFDTESRFQEFKWAQEVALDERMRNVQPGQADGFAGAWADDYVKSASKFFEGVPQQLKQKYERKLFSAERQLFGEATTFARGEQKRFSVVDIRQKTENIYRARARTTPMTGLDELTAEHERLVRANPHLTPIEKDELIREGRRNIAISHFDALDPEQKRRALRAGSKPTSAEELLRKFEGFQAEAKWDVNAYRAGYGSDTVTLEDGSVVKVQPDTKVTKEDAERDLIRRAKEFAGIAENQVGEETWAALPHNVRSALVSVAYNHGSLPRSVVRAVASGNVNEVADAVEALPSNPNRRKQEADIIRGASQAAPAAFAELTQADRDKVRADIERFEAAQQKEAAKRLKEFQGLFASTERKKIDPVAFVMSDEAVGAAYDTAFAQPSAEVWANAIDAGMEAQRALGLPEARIKALPNRVASALVEQIQTAEDPGATFGQIREQFGDKWRRVQGELIEQGLAPDFQLLSTIDPQINPVAYDAVARVAKISEKDLKEGLGSVNVNTDVVAPLEDRLADFFSAFESGPFVVTEQSAGLMSALRKVAIAHLRTNPSDTAGAVEKAAAIIEERFDIVESANAKVILPKDEGVSPAQLELAMSREQSRRKIEAFDPLPVGDVFGTVAAVSKAATVRTAVNSGVWVTNPEGDGAMLLVPFRGGGFLPLTNKDGEFYQIRFADVIGADGGDLGDDIASGS